MEENFYYVGFAILFLIGVWTFFVERGKYKRFHTMMGLNIQVRLYEPSEGRRTPSKGVVEMNLEWMDDSLNDIVITDISFNTSGMYFPLWQKIYFDFGTPKPQLLSMGFRMKPNIYTKYKGKKRNLRVSGLLRRKNGDVLTFKTHLSFVLNYKAEDALVETSTPAL